MATEGVTRSHDGEVRSAHVKVQSKTGRTTILKRPIQHLYPLEVGVRNPVDAPPESTSHSDSTEIEIGRDRRPRRSAAVDRIFAIGVAD